MGLLTSIDCGPRIGGSPEPTSIDGDDCGRGSALIDRVDELLQE